jgi:hypothetical protein
MKYVMLLYNPLKFQREVVQNKVYQNYLALITLKVLKTFYIYTKVFSSRILALGSTQPLTEMSTRNLPGEGGGGGKGRPACRADNLTAICGPIVWKIWEPQRLATLWASRAFLPR